MARYYHVSTDFLLGMSAEADPRPDWLQPIAPGVLPAFHERPVYVKGRGYVKKLEEQGLFTMGDIARSSLRNEDLLYRMFGANAELLIDHAWGWPPCTIKYWWLS